MVRALPGPGRRGRSRRAGSRCSWYFPRPLLALWAGAPWIAWRISQPIDPAPAGLSDAQELFLRAAARRTWHFFDTFVTAEEHHLPPDNFQEEPVRRLASRTSPTNLGLALLSNLAARDFGYLSAGQLVRRTADALATMEGLERHQGHFYNWYDTRTLALTPLYVSTVDSGNLAGHLLTLAPGLQELAAQEILPPAVFAGLRDACRILREAWSGADGEEKKLEELLRAPPETLQDKFSLLQQAVDPVRPPGRGGPPPRRARSRTRPGPGRRSWPRAAASSGTTSSSSRPGCPLPRRRRRAAISSC